jgi:hypothetical protein
MPVSPCRTSYTGPDTVVRWKQPTAAPVDGSSSAAFFLWLVCHNDRRDSQFLCLMEYFFLTSKQHEQTRGWMMDDDEYY